MYDTVDKNADLKEIVHTTFNELSNLLSIGPICVYLLENDLRFYLAYSHGLPEESRNKSVKPDQVRLVYEVAESRSSRIIEAGHESIPEEGLQPHHRYSSIAYIPLKTTSLEVFGVLVFWYTWYTPWAYFPNRLDGILEFVGHRISMVMENAILHQKLMQSEERYGILFNNIPHSIFLLDGKDFTIIDSNVRAHSAYGYTKEEFLGMPFLKLTDENDEELLAGLRSVSEKQYCRIAKKLFYPKNGQPFFVNVNISPAKYNESHIVIVSTTDITKSVEKETQLIHASKMTTLGLMCAGMAHEINQPLNIIQVCADYFIKMLNRKQSIPNDDLLSMTNDIIANVRRISETINHVRDFSRQSEVNKSKIDINKPIQDACRILDFKIKAHKIDTVLDLEKELPSIMADHKRLEQVFINLVNNSIEAIDEKCRQNTDQDIERRLTIRSFAEDARVVATITDTGIGMSKGTAEKIFQPFFTTKRDGKATGLSISSSYGIIKDYDGSITFESREGVGTTFVIKFPPHAAA